MSSVAKNVSDTDAYTLFDHVFSKTLRSLSRVVGLRKVTQPFWNRWLASGVDERIIFRFLDRIGSMDAWASVAADVASEEIDSFRRRRSGLARPQEIGELRALSYLCNMAQWGCLPLTDSRRSLYAQCRDFYLEAETLAHGDRFRRLDFAFGGRTLHANLHVPEGPAGPLATIVHGIDGCKEEHLATELALLRAGFAVLGFDGPGQAEALLLDRILWRPDFHRSISAAIDAAGAGGRALISRCGVLGVSIGGMWALQAASTDARISAVFDLGGPVDARRFSRTPFLIKTRLCQVTGARTDAEIAAVLAHNSLRDEETLARIRADVRIVHGGRDRIVAVGDKVWLTRRLAALHADRRHSMRIVETGDHCCTGHVNEIRQDSAAFFVDRLLSDRSR